MKKLRASSYLNHVEIGDGTSLLYSGSTQCIDLVPTEYANLLSDGADLSFLSSEETEHLLQRGHLTAVTPRRELEEFRKLLHIILQKSNRFDKKRKMGNLSFILTYHCNLSCSYCYQKSLGQDFKVPPMSPELVDSIFATYLSQLFPKIPREFVFTLFGGEPLFPTNRDYYKNSCLHEETPFYQSFRGYQCNYFIGNGGFDRPGKREDSKCPGDFGWRSIVP